MIADSQRIFLQKPIGHNRQNSLTQETTSPETGLREIISVSFSSKELISET